MGTAEKLIRTWNAMVFAFDRIKRVWLGTTTLQEAEQDLIDAVRGCAIPGCPQCRKEAEHPCEQDDRPWGAAVREFEEVGGFDADDEKPCDGCGHLMEPCAPTCPIAQHRAQLCGKCKLPLGNCTSVGGWHPWCDAEQAMIDTLAPHAPISVVRVDQLTHPPLVVRLAQPAAAGNAAVPYVDLGTSRTPDLTGGHNGE